MISFSIEGKKADVFPAESPGMPAVYLNTFEGEGEKVLEELKNGGYSDFNLIALSGLNWDRDMSPWDCPALFKNSGPIEGRADEYLGLLTERIIPEAEKYIEGALPWRGIAGYSLAGLFSVYASCVTDAFSRTASVSGSLWFPGFREFVLSRGEGRLPESAYFSLGDRENKTRNRYMSGVLDDTRAIEEFFEAHGVDCALRMNPGGHHTDAEKRTAQGIDWILRRP